MARLITKKDVYDRWVSEGQLLPVADNDLIKEQIKREIMAEMKETV